MAHFINPIYKHQSRMLHLSSESDFKRVNIKDSSAACHAGIVSSLVTLTKDLPALGLEARVVGVNDVFLGEIKYFHGQPDCDSPSN